MGKIKKLIFRGGTANYEINTFIGGVSSVINTPQLLANKLLLYPSYEDLPVTSIKGFKIVGGNIECSIDVEYTIKNSAFINTNFTAASPTYYRDEQGKCKILGGSSFYVSLRTDEFYFPGVLDINTSSFYHANHTSLNPRIMYFPSCTVVSGDPTVAEVPQFGYGNIIQKLYINTFNQTSNNGGINATIAYGIANDNLEVVWIENLIKPNPITDLSIIEILISTIEISWTAPSSSTNTIDFYEVYVNGAYNLKTSDLTATVTGLSPETTYEIHVVVVDEFYNKSEISNVIEVTTLEPVSNVEDILQYAISRYKLDTDATDSIGDNDGVGTFVTYSEGLVNNAGVFNGTVSDIEIPHDSSLEFTDGVNDKPFSLSICAYFTNLNTSDGHWLINKRDDSVLWAHQLIVTSVFHFAIHDDTNLGFHKVEYPFTPTLNTWYHLTATYDGSGEIGGMSLYIDGVKLNTVDTVSGIYDSMKIRSSVTNIGRRGWDLNTLGRMDGKLDEVMFWNKELTQEEVTYLSDNQLAGIDIDAVIPLSNIISEYKFEENALDTIGNNDGVATNVSYVNSNIGKAGSFNGANSLVTINNPVNLSFIQVPFSISFLVKFNSVPAIAGLVVKDLNTTENREYIFDYFDTGFRGVLINKDSNANIKFQTTTSISTGEWVHVVYTFDGGILSEGGKIYIDGTQQALTLTENASYTGMVESTIPVHLGQFTPIVGRELDGEMDCVRFWNIELSTGQIKKIATEELAGVDINPTIPLNNIISRWKFDNNTLDSVGVNDGIGTLVTFEDELIDKAVKLENVDSNVEVVHDSSLFLGTDFSISFMVKWDVIGSTVLICKKDKITGDTFEWQVAYNDSSIEYVIAGNGSVHNRLGSFFSFSPQINTWYHVCVTYNGEIENEDLKLYIDGVKLTWNGSTNNSGEFTGALVETTGPIIMFKNAHNNTRTLQGKGDEVILWNRELTPNKITKLASDQLAGIDIDPPVATGTAFSTATTGTVFSGVCATTSDTIRYHDGVGLLPEIGDNVFDDEQMQIPFDGAGQYYKVLTENYVQILNGSIAAFDLCGL